ncbi:MAG: Cytosine/adenosine deaminase [Rhodobacteraceae bacterium HLUCCA08]|nr:MAG: Cytosine/adenosine deaminase [Rhodobacteraceae bacterium HLUCCA08]
MTPTALERDTCHEIALWAARLDRDGADAAFTAAVIRDGAVIARARNAVMDSGDPTRHAEIVAIGEAARAAGGRDLSGATLVASCQPCEMCLGAMRWAGIARLVFAARKPLIGDANFRFPGLGIDDFHRASGAGFDYAGGIGEEIVGHLYR